MKLGVGVVMFHREHKPPFFPAGYGSSVRECIDASPVGGLCLRHVVPGAYRVERINFIRKSSSPQNRQLIGYFHVPGAYFTDYINSTVSGRRSPQKTVNVLFELAIVNNELTILWGS